MPNQEYDINLLIPMFLLNCILRNHDFQFWGHKYKDNGHSPMVIYQFINIKKRPNGETTGFPSYDSILRQIEGR